MAVFRKINLLFWEDTKVVDDFTPEDKYFMLYLMTNPHTNQLGCYNITIRQMEFETGYNKDTIQKLLIRLENVLNVIKYSEETKEVLILNWHKYNWSSSPKILSCIKKEVETIKNKEFRYYIDTLFIQYGYSIDTQTQKEKEKEEEEEKEEYKEEEKNISKKSKKIDAYASKEVNEFIKVYEDNNNSGRILNQTRLKIAQAIEINGLDVMLEVIKKSANKGHLINNEFIPLSVENMLENAQKILDDNYNLVDRQNKKLDIENMTNEDAEKLIFG